MDKQSFENLKQVILTKLLTEKEKEYYCHVQFVSSIGSELAKTCKVNKSLVETACLLHDIGRDFEIKNEDHGDAGERISKDILHQSGFTFQEQKLILKCIKNHCKELPPEKLSVEERIIITADSASKVLFHEAFTLLCKKQTYSEKLEWAKKYLEKGYKNILFSDYKTSIESRYRIIKNIYEAVGTKKQ